MEAQTPKGMRLHIGLFGKRNVGKSSVLNKLTDQDVAIVSPVPGTTTDVVSKPMELKPIGPVLFLDTAGLDDEGTLGKQRVDKTIQAMDRVDLAFIISDGIWNETEKHYVKLMKENAIPFIIVFNKCDLNACDEAHQQEALQATPYVVSLSAKTGEGMETLRELIVKAAPKTFLDNPPILSDLVGPGDTVVLVVPIDMEAPKGRLILPQVQTIREILDCDGKALVVKERELADAMIMLKQPPKLVVTDSQAILKVAADVPDNVLLTGFSVLFARWKGDLETFVKGTAAVDQLKEGATILLLETCTHHPIEDDIGRVKIPRWLRQYTGLELHFEHQAGHDLPDDLSCFDLIIHCGSCMGNRKEMLSRILKAKKAGVPITNYGLVIAKSLGVLQRMLSPFPGMKDFIKESY